MYDRSTAQSYDKHTLPPLHAGNAVLLFSVELLDLTKKPIVSLPQGSGFYTACGVMMLLGLGGYELYRRAKQEATKPGKSKEQSNKRSQQKKTKRKD